MTNIDLINYLMDLFRDYMQFYLPVFGVMAGIHLILNMLWAACFGAFDKGGR